MVNWYMVPCMIHGIYLNWIGHNLTLRYILIPTRSQAVWIGLAGVGVKMKV